MEVGSRNGCGTGRGLWEVAIAHDAQVMTRVTVLVAAVGHRGRASLRQSTLFVSVASVWSPLRSSDSPADALAADTAILTLKETPRALTCRCIALPVPRM